MNRWCHAAAALALAALTAGCSTVPPRDAELEDARAALAEASEHPFATSAMPELERAQAGLAAAEQAWQAGARAGAALAGTRQRAYLARRQAQIALAVATQAQNEQRAADAERAATELRLQHSLRAGR